MKFLLEVGQVLIAGVILWGMTELMGMVQPESRMTPWKVVSCDVQLPDGRILKSLGRFEVRVPEK